MNNGIQSNNKNIENNNNTTIKKVSSLGGLNSNNNIDKDKQNDVFNEKVKKYNEYERKIKNRNIIKTIFKEREFTIDEKNQILKDFIEVESKIEAIEKENPKLKDYILNNLKDNIDNSNKYVDDIKNKYLQLEKNKNRIALGKVVLKELEEGKKIPQDTLKQIPSILNINNDIALDLGLDLSLLKSSLLESIDTTISNNNNDFEKYKQKDSELQERIKQNQLRGIKIEKGEKLLEKETDEKRKEFIKNSIEKERQKYLEEKEINEKLSKEMKKEEITKNIELEKIKELKEIEEELKSQSIDNNKYEIDDEIKDIFIEDYNNTAKNIENLYTKKIFNDRDLDFKDIKETILKQDYDIDGEIAKKRREEKNILTQQEKQQQEKEIAEKIYEIDAEIEEQSNIEILDNDDTQTRARKNKEKSFAVIEGGFKKLKVKAGGQIQEKIDKIHERDKLNQKIKLVNSNIQTKIDNLEKEFDEYKKHGNYDPEKIKDFEYKIKGYNDLKNKLGDSKIPLNEKKGLVSLLGKGEWLQDYIKVRGENYKYTHDITKKELGSIIKQGINGDYKNIGKDKIVDIYKKRISSEKYSIIEEFAKLKSTIPNFENVGINDNLLKLGEGVDKETEIKINKLIDLQNTIKNLNLDYETNTFLQGIDQIIKSKEIRIQEQKDYADKENIIIDRLDIPEEEKNKRKQENINYMNEQIAEIEKEKKILEEEYNKIENLGKKITTFSKNEIKDISDNIDLFSVVANHDYGEIIDSIEDDVSNGNTSFIDFQNYKNIKNKDYYTTDILNKLTIQELNDLDENIALLEKDNSPNAKKYKRELINERIKIKQIVDNVKNGRILEDGVIEFLDEKSLFKIKLQEENKNILKKLEDPNLGEEEKLKLKKELAKNFKELENVKKNNIDILLKEKIKDAKSSFNLNEELIKKELEDGFNNANVSDGVFSSYKGFFNDKIAKAKTTLDVIGITAKEGGKVIVKEAFGEGVNVYKEDKDSRHLRHEKVDKYLNAFFVGGISYIFLMIPKLLNQTSKQISKFPQFIDLVRKHVDQMRSKLFMLNLLIVFIIVFFTPNNDFHFMNLNTHLYTINNYLTTNGNIKFADSLGKTGEALYFKLNIYLFFIFLIVLYKIIIEFMHKYILILKNAKVGIDLFLLSIGKMLIFFIYLSIIFRINTIIS